MTITNNTINNTISPETVAELEELFAERKPAANADRFYHDALVTAPGYTEEILRVIYSEEDRARYAEELGVPEDALAIFFPSSYYTNSLDLDVERNVYIYGGDTPVVTTRDLGISGGLVQLPQLISWLNSVTTRVVLTTGAYLSYLACIIDVLAPKFRYLYRSATWDEEFVDGFAELVYEGCFESDDALEEAARRYIECFLETLEYGLDPNDECSADILSLTFCSFMTYDGLEDWDDWDRSAFEYILRNIFDAA